MCNFIGQAKPHKIPNRNEQILLANCKCNNNDNKPHGVLELSCQLLVKFYQLDYEACHLIVIDKYHGIYDK